MRNHVLSALLLCSIPICSATPETVHEKPALLPLCAAFEQFMESLVGLFKKDTLVEGMESIEETTAHLLETAFSIMGGNVHPQLYKEKTKLAPLIAHELLIHTLEPVVAAYAHTLKTTRAARPAQSYDTDEDNQRKIVSLFAGIVKHFFNIAQDPENRENVLPNLMEMAAGIVEIGGEVIRSSALTLHASLEEINAYVNQLDLHTKEAMLSIVQQKAQDMQSTPKT